MSVFEWVETVFRQTEAENAAEAEEEKKEEAEDVSKFMDSLRKTPNNAMVNSHVGSIKRS